MTEGQRLLRHTALYGLTLGAVFAVYQLILYYFGANDKDSLKNLGVLLIILGVFFSVKHYRDEQENGSLEFGRAYIAAWATCLFAGTVMGIYNLILHKYLSPGLVQEKINQILDIYTQQGFTVDQLKTMSDIFNKIVTPELLAFSVLFSMAFWGALLSLLVAILLKKPANPLLKAE